jgi:ABC-type Fe3+-hydroxamate transport system substrate-binding protein
MAAPGAAASDATSNPRRIVSLAPSLTELAYAAGAGDLLVAASAYSDYPPAARQLPQVADAAGVNWEALLAQRPGLVLAWESGTRAADLARLAELKIPTLTIGIRRLDDLPRAILSIGAASGRMTSARIEAARIRRALEAIGATPLLRVAAFIEISERPLMTVGGQHVLSEVLARCGGDNIFADLASPAAEPSLETVIARKPRVILRPRNRDAASSTARPSWLPPGALDDARTEFFNPDWAFRPGPRLVEAMREICAALERVRVSIAAGN